MRVETEGELIVYMQLAQNSHKIISSKSQTFLCQAGIKKTQHLHWIFL